MVLPDTLRELPYLVHTNRELGLMLAGKKPMAYFMGIDGRERACVVRYLRMFDRHVKLGTLMKFERSEAVPQLPHRISRRIIYTLPGEEWRVPALLDVLTVPTDWDDVRERRLGSLLGYEDWQNDFWISRVRSLRGG